MKTIIRFNIVLSLFLTVIFAAFQNLYAGIANDFLSTDVFNQTELAHSLHQDFLMPNSTTVWLTVVSSKHSYEPFKVELKRKGFVANFKYNSIDRVAFSTEIRVYHNALISRKLTNQLFPFHFFW